MDRILDQLRTFRADGRIDCGCRPVIVGKHKDIRLVGELYSQRVDCPSEQCRIADTIDEARRWLDVEASGFVEPAE